MCDEQGWHLTLDNAAGNDSNTAFPSPHYTAVSRDGEQYKFYL